MRLRCDDCFVFGMHYYWRGAWLCLRCMQWRMRYPEMMPRGYAVRQMMWLQG